MTPLGSKSHPQRYPTTNPEGLKESIANILEPKNSFRCSLVLQGEMNTYFKLDVAIISWLIMYEVCAVSFGLKGQHFQCN